jgi:hypothetical protein
MANACPTCGAVVGIGAEKCPQCGGYVSKLAAVGDGLKAIGCLISLVVFIIVPGALFLFGCLSS